MAELETLNPNNLIWAADAYRALGSDYRQFHDYYAGDQKLMMSDETRRLFKRLFGHMRYNVCPTVVDTIAGRLQLTGFQTEDEDAEAYLTDLQSRKRWQTLYARLHREASKEGDGYLIVWPNEDGEPTIYLQPYGTMVVRYDFDADVPKIVEAVKFWYYKAPNSRTDYVGRLTHYTPEAIYRYVRPKAGGVPQFPEQTAGAWVPYLDDGQPVVQNTYSRVPVFRFSPALDDTAFAQSELRDVIPLQDALNKTFIDTLVGGEYQGLAQRYVAGLDLEIDTATGQYKYPFNAGSNRLWVTPAKDANFGQFPAADLKQLWGQIEGIEARIARVSRTPFHLFALEQSAFPSGEALKTAEAPLLSKVAERQAVWGDTWEDVMSFVLEIGGKAAVPITSIWADTTPRAVKEQAETAILKKEIGVSDTQLRREMGYTDEQIETMDEENDQDAQRASETAARAFNANGNLLR